MSATISLPRQVILNGPSAEVLQQAIVLASRGYTFHEWQMQQAIPNVAGTVLTMVRGLPDSSAIKAADEAVARALEMEQAQALHQEATA
jgi:hypothetical protein